MAKLTNEQSNTVETAKGTRPNRASFLHKLPYKRIGIAALSLTVLVTTGVSNHVYGDQLNDILYDTPHSTTESSIKAAVEHVSGSSITIRCVDQTFLQDVAGRPDGSSSGIGGLTQFIGNIPTSINIDNKFCTDIVAYAETPTIRNNPSPVVARAVGVLAHEYSHHELGVVDESEAGCHSVQISSELAQAMGATHGEAVLLRERLNALFTPLVSPDVNPYIAPYGITSDCVAGGAYDLDLPRQCISTDRHCAFIATSISL